MAFKFGSTGISAFKYGATPISRLYQGGTQIWSAVTDPMALLLHFDGNFNDSSLYALTGTPNGNASISAAQSRFGGYSAYFGGSGDCVSLSSEAPLIVGAEDWTVEAWVFLSAEPSGNQTLIGKGVANVAPAVENNGFSEITFGSNGDIRVVMCATNDFGAGWLDAHFTTPTSTFNAGSWNHVAVCRVGEYIKCFWNGLLIGSTFYGTYAVWSAAGVPILIGARHINNTSTFDQYFNGYIDELRITKGVALYTADFDVPTVPFSADATMLLRFDGNFNDSSGDNLQFTPSGTVTTTAAQSKFGGFSGYFDNVGSSGASDLYLPDAANIQLGDRDWTIEGWVYLNSLNSWNGLVAKRDYAAENGLGGILIGSSGELHITAATGGSWSVNADVATGFTTGTWHHWAVVRRGNAIYGFRDGILGGATNISGTINDANSEWRIGSAAYPGQYLDGYLDDVRITLGYAVYTRTFTPPTAPLPAVVTVNPVVASLLLDFDSVGDNYFHDSSVYAHPVYGNGPGGTLDEYQVSFSQSKFGGGSAFFDGASYRLSLNAALNWEQDFTVEFWFYRVGISESGIDTFLAVGDIQGGIGGLHLYVDGSDVLSWNDGFSSAIVGGSMPIGVWVHVAAVRHNGTNTLYVNGSAVGTSTQTFPVTNNLIEIGAANNYGFYATGYMDDFRIVSGLAVYTGPFNVPSKALSTLPAPAPVLPTLQLSYTVIGGGGAGGVHGGGGGGGGFLEGSNYSVVVGHPLAVTVGAGGAAVSTDSGLAGTTGGDSVFDAVTAYGGGGGGGYDVNGVPYIGSPELDGRNGASGGGGGTGWYVAGLGGSNFAYQGNYGGNGYNYGDGSIESSGGGGGAGSFGWNGSGATSGFGGDGLMATIAMTAGNYYYYSGGGGGGGAEGASGGFGGGGYGVNSGTAGSGAANTGGGGGGSNYDPGSWTGAGGSGVVLLRFPEPHTLDVGAGLTYYTYTDGPDIVYVFTAGTDAITFTS